MRSIGPSPAWLAERLEAAGVRRISNIVDVTNYVMLEMGQPMHAFDSRSCGGRALRIRRAKPGEKLRTLDGVDRALDADMLVIADAERAQAIAGVMGGARLGDRRGDEADGARERVLPAGVGAAHEQAPGLEDRGVDPLRARRRRRRARRAAIARAAALLEQIGAGAAARPR